MDNPVLSKTDAAKQYVRMYMWGSITLDELHRDLYLCFDRSYKRAVEWLFENYSIIEKETNNVDR